MTTHWAAILAGGDGTRLKPLTRVVAGDDRPKQFCALVGGRTLFAETRARVALNVVAERTIYVVTRPHATYYRDDLAGVPGPLVVEQPRNCGTAPAIACALARVQQSAEDSVIGFFPADHYYLDSERLRHTLVRAYDAARAYPTRVLLLGAHATRAETEYGWIEPGPVIGPAADGRLHSVARFWEKPTPRVAARLLRQQFLWNTFVLVGHARAFDALLRDAVPALWDAFAVLREAPLPLGSARIDALYQVLPTLDFSADVLSTHADRLAVLRLPDAGWTDLGHPARVFDLVARRSLGAAS